MIEIALLGRAAITSPEGAVTGEAAQRRRLALVALLCDTGMRAVSRDRLMSLLWPAHDTESARHLLSASLHVLRKALGTDAIIATGDMVALNPDVVRVDAIEFENAVRLGAAERAAELYCGAFGEGLSVPGAVDFEHWLDGRRAELARLYATSLERAAQACTQRGDLDGAVTAWRRLAALDPYSARTTLGLMRALAAAGHRAAALQSAQVHARLLEAEFDATPEPDVLRLAEQLRQETSPTTAPDEAGGSDPDHHAGTGAVHEATVTAAVREPAADLQEHVGASNVGTSEGRTGRGLLAPGGGSRRARIAAGALALAAVMLIAVAVLQWVRAREPQVRMIAVVPLRTGTDTGSDHLAAGIAEGIHDRLSSSRELRVVNSASSFLFRDSAADARSIGARLGVDAIVFVRLRTTDEMLRVRVELTRARDRVVLWDTLHTTRPADVFTLEDELSRSVGAALRIRLRGSDLALGRGAGDDVAQELYWRAREEARRRTPDALQRALPLFQRAVDRDPTHAAALVGLADSYNLLGTFEYGILPPESAYPLSLAAAERALAIAPDYAPALAARANVRMNFEWDWDGAERDFRRAIAVAPGLVEAREWLASLLMARGRGPEAMEMLHAAEQNSGGSPLLFTNLAQYHYFAGEHVTAHENIARALQLDPLFSRAHVLRALVLCQEGRTDEALLTLEALAPYRESDPLIAALLGYAYGRAGRRNEAIAQMQWLESRRRQRYVPAEYLATVQLGLEHWDAALDHLEAAFANRSTGMLYLRHEPMLNPIRDHPRLQALIAHVHRQ